MDRASLLKTIISSRIVMSNGNGFSVDMPKNNNPVSNDLAIYLAMKVKTVDNFDCVIGEVDRPHFSKNISMLLNNIKVYYPEKRIDFPASLSRLKDNNLLIVKGSINNSDVREVVDFSRSVADEPFGRAVLAAPFDLREKFYDPGIDVVSVFQRKDFVF